MTNVTGLLIIKESHTSYDIIILYSLIIIGRFKSPQLNLQLRTLIREK